MLSLLPAFHCFSNVTNSRFSGADRRMSACHCCAAFTDRGALLDLPHKGLLKGGGKSQQKLAMLGTNAGSIRFV